MSIRGNFLYLRIVTPDVRWIRFIIPVFIVTEIVEGLIDLIALGALVAPRVKLNKNGLKVGAIYTMLIGVETLLGNLQSIGEEDLVNISLGSENISIVIKVI